MEKYRIITKINSMKLILLYHLLACCQCAHDGPSCKWGTVGRERCWSSTFGSDIHWEGKNIMSATEPSERKKTCGSDGDRG